MRLRRVGFRNGTDQELVALHAVESVVAAECGSHRMPQQLDGYISFARNLPSSFHDHAWLAESEAGEALACGFCWYNSAADDRVMHCDVLVRFDQRRRGIGTMLLREICAVAVAEDRSTLMWSTYDATPAGEAFSRRVGASVGRVNRTSELALADVDWTMVADWSRASKARDPGYRIDVIDGVYPEHARADAVAFHRIMQSAPREDLEIGDVKLDSDFVAERDRAMLEAGQQRWTMFVHDADDVCVGGTEITFDPSEPAVAFQQNTGIDVAHRGRGLAKWVKGSMLERLRAERPNLARVRTDNAYSNAPMIGINTALGFRIMSSRTEWQADAGPLMQTLG